MPVVDALIATMIRPKDPGSMMRQRRSSSNDPPAMFVPGEASVRFSPHGFERERRIAPGRKRIERNGGCPPALAGLIARLQIPVETGFAFRRTGRGRTLLRIGGARALPRRFRLLPALRLPLHHHAQGATVVQKCPLQAGAPKFSRSTGTANDVVRDNRCPTFTFRANRTRAFETERASQVSDRFYRGCRGWLGSPERMPQGGEEAFLLHSRAGSRNRMRGTRLSRTHAGVRRRRRRA